MVPQSKPLAQPAFNAATRSSASRCPKNLKLWAATLTLALAALGFASTLNAPKLTASDHDDGDIDVRSRALSLTDLYAFREKDQNPSAQDGDLILVMNTNPRSLARQQYFFSENARYEFRISRVQDKNAVPSANADIRLQFEFSPPDRSNRQRIKFTAFDGGDINTLTSNNDGTAITTTTLNDSPKINRINVRGQIITAFAGLREDPFYFDVEQFFRVRAGLAGFGPKVGFRPANTALDFAKGYNVNAIVVRVPRSLLQRGSNTTTFDVWLSLLIKDPRNDQFVQTEQLARPGLNEALLISQTNLAAYNRLQPTRTVTPELLEVRNEAKQTLLALGNTDARAESLLTAFLPDVMRIDTTGPSGFANDLNTLGSPIRGRKLEDDVIDIALTVLSNGAVKTDNVSYQGTPGNPAQGHQPLVGSFPYLALPN